MPLCFALVAVLLLSSVAIYCSHKYILNIPGLLIELCLDQYDKLSRASVASSSAMVAGVAICSESQRKAAMHQLEVKVMNMLDGTVAGMFLPNYIASVHVVDNAFIY